LSSTVDQAVSWQSNGAKVMALGAAQAVTAGYVYVGWFAQGGTLPLFARSVSQGSLGNLSLTGTAGVGTAWRFAAANAGLTTAMPATLSSMGSNVAFWAGIS